MSDQPPKEVEQWFVVGWAPSDLEAVLSNRPPKSIERCDTQEDAEVSANEMSKENPNLIVMVYKAVAKYNSLVTVNRTEL